MTKKTTTRHWSDALVEMRACSDAVEWARTQPSLAVAWKACRRADWMLWLAARCSGKHGSAAHRRVVLAACACARTGLSRLPADENRPRLAIETAERWARRKRGVTLAMVRDAADAAYAAADAAARDDERAWQDARLIALIGGAS